MYNQFLRIFLFNIIECSKKKKNLYFITIGYYLNKHIVKIIFLLVIKKISPFILNPLDILVQKIAHEKIIKESLEIIEQSVENLYKNANDMKIDSFDLINSNLFKKNNWFNLLSFKQSKINEENKYWVDIFSKFFYY